MSKRTDESKRLASLPPKPSPVKRDLTPQECMELQEKQRLINARHYEAGLVKGNSALVPRGQEIAAELEALVRLLENDKNLWVAQTLLNCGYPEGTLCSINLTTGEITVPNEPKDDTKTA